MEGYYNTAILISLSVLISEVSSKCPEGFRLHGKSCYYAVPKLKFNWLGALNYCLEEFDSELVNIETEEENDFVVSYLDSFRYEYGFSSDVFWTGGFNSYNPVNSSLGWIWRLPGTNILDSFYDPSILESGNEPFQCLGICWNIKEKSWKWKGTDCDDFKHPICERDVVQSTYGTASSITDGDVDHGSNSTTEVPIIIG